MAALEVTNVTLKTVVLVCLVSGLISTAFSRTAFEKTPGAEDLYLQLQRVGLDKTRVYKIRDGAIDRAAIHISLDDGTIAFTADVDGRITGAFFKGEGEILLAPPDTTERGSLAFFTGAAILEEKFSSAYLRFNDDVFDQLKTAFRTPDSPDAFASEWNTTAQNLAHEDALRVLTTFLNTPTNAANDDHFLHAYLQGERLGTFEVRYDSLAPEQVSAGEHKTQRGEVFYDVWTSFAVHATVKPSSEPGPSEPPLGNFEISEFKIKAKITPPNELQATTVLRIIPRRSGKRMLLFELSRLLQVNKVEAGGQPVEFIHNPAIEGSQLARRGNDILAVIFPSPLEVGHKIELSFEYAGAVLSEAGEGLLYVGEHGTWYPNIGFAKTSFDMQFNYPVGWTVVATGRRTELKTEGAEQTSKWTSERPIPVAGFNLGKYSRSTTRAGAAIVTTYATANVERGFPEPVDPPAPPIPGLIGKRQPQPMTPPPDVPSPARNAQAVGISAAKAVEFYQQRFGPYPYSELSLTQFPGTNSQGWPGLIFLYSYAFLTPAQRERLQPDPKLRLALELTTAHEVAHQWWGDLVIWNGYRDQWLMEALANYSALMLLETRNPGAFHQLMQKYRDDLLAKNHKGQALMAAGPVSFGARLSSSAFPDGYEVISYGRGTWLIHMLRCMLRDAERSKPGHQKTSADEAFMRALRKLIAEHQGKPLSSVDLVNAMQSELPPNLWYEGRKSLQWFYDGWLNGNSIPSFSLRDLKFTDKPNGTLVTGTIVQEHAPDNLVTAVPVYASSSGKNVFLGRVFVEGGEVQFHLSAPAGTRRVLLDPEQTLLSRNK